MPKTMQNLIVLMELSEKAYRTSLKTGNMILNRFCIDEDAAFELSGVNYLKKTSLAMATIIPSRRWGNHWGRKRKGRNMESWPFTKVKGKGYSF